MRRGAPKLGDRSYYCKQTNNAFEEYLKTRYGERWLTTCGPSSMVNCVGALGRSTGPTKLGSFEFQPEDLVTLFFNDYRNFEDFKKVRDYSIGVLAKTPKNEIPQYYPLASEALFGVKSELLFGLSFESIRDRVVTGKHTIQACLRHPAHYIALVGYDDEKDSLIYDDSYPERFSDKNGFNRSMSRIEFVSNMDNYFIVYTG